MGEGRFDPVIDRVLPLKEAAEAHRILERREHLRKDRSETLTIDKPGEPFPRKSFRHERKRGIEEEIFIHWYSLTWIKLVAIVKA